MAATMSKTSWFKRNGGKGCVIHDEASSTPTQNSSPPASRPSVFKAFRMGSGSLSSRAHSSSPSSSFTSTRSPSTSSNLNPLPLTVSPSASDSSSLPSSSLPNTHSTAQHPPSRASGSFSHPVNAARPSQDDPFANLSHSAGPLSTSVSLSTPHFDGPSANHSAGAKRRPSVATTPEATTRRRVLSSPSTSDIEGPEAPSTSSIVTGVSNVNSGTLPSTSGTTATPTGSLSSSQPAAVFGSSIRRRNTVSTAIDAGSASPPPSLTAAAFAISNNLPQINAHSTPTTSRPVRPVINISLKGKGRNPSNRSSDESDDQLLQTCRPLSGLALSVGSPSAILEAFQDWQLNDHDDSDIENVQYGRELHGSSLATPAKSHGMQQQESADGAGGQLRQVGKNDQLPPLIQTRGMGRKVSVLSSSSISSPGDEDRRIDEEDEAAPLQPPRLWGASTTTLQFARGRTGSESEGAAETPTPARSNDFSSRLKSLSRRPVTSPRSADNPYPPPLAFLPNDHQPQQQQQQQPPIAATGSMEHIEAVLSSPSPSKHSIGLPSWLGGERSSQQHKRRSSNSIPTSSSPPPQRQGLASPRSSSSLTMTGAAARRPPSAASSVTSLGRRNSSRAGTYSTGTGFGSSRIGIHSSSSSTSGRVGGAGGLATPTATVEKKPSLMHSISLMDLHERRQKQMQQLRDDNIVAPSVLGSNISMGGGPGTSLLLGAGSNPYATQFIPSMTVVSSGGKRTPTPPILRHASSFDPPRSTASSSPASSIFNLPSVGTAGNSTTPTRSPGKLMPHLPPTPPLGAPPPGIENPSIPASVFPMTGNPGALARQRSFGSTGWFSSNSSAATSTADSSVSRASRSDSQSTSLSTIASPISPISTGPEFNQESEAVGAKHLIQEPTTFIPGMGFGTAALKAQQAAQNQSVSPKPELMASASFGPPSHKIGESRIRTESSTPDLSYAAAAAAALAPTAAGPVPPRPPAQTRTGDRRAPTADLNSTRNRSTTVSTAVTISSAPVGNTAAQNNDSTEQRARSATVASSSLVSFLPSFDAAPSAPKELTLITKSPTLSLGLGLEGPSSNPPDKPFRRPSTTEVSSVIPSLVKGSLGGLAVPPRPTKAANSLPVPPRSRSARPSNAGVQPALLQSSISDAATIRPSAASRKVASASSLPGLSTTFKPPAPVSTPVSISPGFGLSPVPRRHHSNIQIRTRRNSTRSAASGGSGSSSGSGSGSGSGGGSGSSKLGTVTENSKAAQQIQILAASSRKSSSDALRTTHTNTPPPPVATMTRPLNLRRRPSFLEIESESDVTSGDDFLDLNDARSSMDTHLDDQATVRVTF